MAKVTAKDLKVRTKQGDVLSDSDLDTLAAEAEAGYELERGSWLKVGRPALGEPAGESPRIAFRADQRLFTAARARADAEGITVSALARAAMQRYLQRGSPIAVRTKRAGQPGAAARMRRTRPS